MSRRDTHHREVVQALRNDQWVITDDPLVLDFAGRLVGIDLAAEKLLAAERAERRIAIEIKSFQGSSDVSEFHTAVGQFLNYRYVLGKTMPERTLYLAIPSEAFRRSPASSRNLMFRRSFNPIGSSSWCMIHKLRRFSNGSTDAL